MPSGKRNNLPPHSGVVSGTIISRRLFKKIVQQGRSERRPEAYPLRYVEDLNDARTKLAGFFSILLGCEELFGIGGRKPTELSAVAGAVQDRDLQTLQ